MARTIKCLLVFVSICFSEKCVNASCESLKTDLSISSSNFVLCAIKHAEPVTYCTTCYEEFTKVLISYRSLLSGSEMQYGANVSCKSMYIDKDRLNVIENVVRQAQDMWEAGYCSDCWSDSSGFSNSSTFTNETKDYLDKYKQFEDCRKVNYNPCEKCLDFYQNMNSFYDEMRFRKGEKICFDLQDKTNKTRILWSKKWACCGDRASSMVTFIVIASTSIAVFVAFYATVFLVGRRNENHSLNIPIDYKSSEQLIQPSTSGSAAAIVENDPSGNNR